MFAGIEFGGRKDGQMDQGVQGHDQTATPSAGEAIPFEYRLMTKREISKHFGVTERTIEVWMRRRYIPYIKIGQSGRFRIATVLRYVDDRYLVPAGEPRRRKNHRKPASCGDTRPDAAGAPFHHDPCCCSGSRRAVEVGG